MTDPFARWRNPSGTYDGAGMLAEMSGLSKAEIMWTFERLKYLMQAEGKTKEEAKAIVKEETKTRPWKRGQ